MMRFTGQFAVVTGAAAGIGKAIAAALAREGAGVMLADVERDKVEAATAALKAEGLDVCSAQVDVSDLASVQRLAVDAYAAFGSVNLLFNNAGVGIGGPVEKVKPGAAAWVMGVNVMGVYHGAHVFAPMMAQQGQHAHIINTASEHAVGLPVRGGQVTLYTASKHAVLGLSDGMRRDYAGTNITVSVICPAMVQSEIWNTLRNRPESAGGPRQTDPKYAEANQAGLPAAIAAARILDQVADGEFYIFTHGRDLREVAEPRGAEIASALDRFAARYGDVA